MIRESKRGKTFERFFEGLGYPEVLRACSEAWLSLKEAVDRFGTKDEPNIEDEPNGTEGVAGCPEAESLEDLASKTEAPNQRTAAYLAGMTFHRKAEDPGHEALVTSANVAVLKARREGIGLEDLDKVRFDACQREEGAAIELEGPGGSVTVPVEERSASLERPWSGAYSITKALTG